MAKTQVLTYTIYLRDAALVASLQQQVFTGTGQGPWVTVEGHRFGISRAPYNPVGPGGAAVEYAIAAGAYPPPLPIVLAGQPIPTTGAGYITSPWFNNSFPRDVAVFTRSTGWWIFGSDTKFYWEGRFAVAPPVSGTGVPTTPEPGALVGRPANELLGFTQYAFLHGESHGHDAEVGGVGGASSPVNDRRCVAAARTGAGFGMRCVSVDAADMDAYDFSDLNNVNPTLGAPPGPRGIWQRLYLRPQKYGSATHRFWRGMLGDNKGFSLGVTGSGQLALFKENDAFGAATLIGTFAQTRLGEWMRLDLFLYILGNTSATVDLRVNGVSDPAGSGRYDGLSSNPARYWRSTQLGYWSSDITGLIVDVDDWHAAKLPVTVDPAVAAWNAGTAYVIGNTVRVGTLTYYAVAASTGQTPSGSSTAYWQLLADPVDLRHGTHVVRVTPDGFGPAHAAASWSGTAESIRVLGQRFAHGSAPTQGFIQSTVSGASLQVTLPMGDVAAVPASVGWVALRAFVTMQKASAPALSGSLAYQIGSDAEVTVPITSDAVSSVFAEAITGSLPVARTQPVQGEALTVRYLKGADGLATQVFALTANVLCVGIFGPEDAVEAATTPPPVAVHHNAYPLTPWARQTTAAAPVIAVSGTYTGNGTGQDLLFKMPPAWLYTRKTSANTETGRWWAGLLGGHKSQVGNLNDEIIVASFSPDPTFVPSGPDADQQFQFRVRLAGAGVSVNENGTVYQYIAFCDPAARFSRAFSCGFVTMNLPGVIPLDDPAFVPECAFLTSEKTFGNPSSDGRLLSFKGLGQAADALMQLSGSFGTLTNALTFGTGALTIGAGFILSGDRLDQVGGLVFRRSDGNADVPPILFAGSYTGDGAASRTITLSPATGRRPLYAQVQGTSSAYHRDPGHTGTNSTATVEPLASTTAITAGGIDSFTVGSTLNSNGVLYTYFGFYGCTAAGNAGWSTQCEVIIPAESPAGPEPVIEEVPGPEPEPEPEPEPGVPPGLPTLEDDLASCPRATTALVNLALQRIGINQGIRDLTTDVSAEATAVWLSYDETLLATLREFPWAFATGYGDPLALVAGTVTTPATPDWQYAYRQPEDAVYARRLVRTLAATGIGRTFEPQLLDFRVGQDADGFLIYSNEPQAVLEYTRRPLCPASRGEALFRSAWAWRLAHELAPALARLPDRAQYCWEQYQYDLRVAATKDAGEQQQPPGGVPDWIRGR